MSEFSFQTVPSLTFGERLLMHSRPWPPASAPAAMPRPRRAGAGLVDPVVAALETRADQAVYDGTEADPPGQSSRRR